MTSAGGAAAAVVNGVLFLRGDANASGQVRLSDSVFILEYLFLGANTPSCLNALDSNDDGNVDVSDAIATLSVLFLGQGMIPPPGMHDCGVDPSDDALGCEQYQSCP